MPMRLGALVLAHPLLLACVLAAWRVRKRELDQRVAQGLTVTVLAAITVASLGRGLPGRSSVSRRTSDLLSCRRFQNRPGSAIPVPVSKTGHP